MALFSEINNQILGFADAEQQIVLCKILDVLEVLSCLMSRGAVMGLSQRMRGTRTRSVTFSNQLQG